MAIWKPHHEEKLVKLLKAKSAAKFNHREELFEAFRKQLAYKGVCPHCSAQTFLDARIETKAVKLINMAKKKGFKGALVLPITKSEYQRTKQIEAGAEIKKTDTLAGKTPEERLEHYLSQKDD